MLFTDLSTTPYSKDLKDIKKQQDNIKRLLAIMQEAFSVGIDLFSRAVSHQVSSALMSLTTVFGMGTGGPSL